jgi:hypothetical protein
VSDRAKATHTNKTKLTRNILIFSLIAGDIGDVTLTFTTQNPIPKDGVIFLEVPDTFTDVNAAAVAQ